MYAIACTNEEKVKVTAAPVTAGVPPRPARVDGALRVSVQTGDGTFAPDPADPLSFYAISGDDPGETTYLVEVDADLGGEVALIADTVVLTVNGARAASFGLTSAAPEAK